MTEENTPPRQPEPLAEMTPSPPGENLQGDRRPRRVWPTTMFGLLMLLSGAAFGAGIALFFAANKRPHEPRFTPPAAVSEVAAQIAATCRLSDEQTRQIREIVARHEQAARKLRDEMAAKIGTEFEAFRSEIEKVMTPEQFKAFDERWRRLRARRPGFGPAHTGPGGEWQRPHLLPQFDANKDGKLTQDEVPAAIWQRISGADADGDGSVTQTELDKFRRERVHEPPATTPPAAANDDRKQEP